MSHKFVRKILYVIELKPVAFADSGFACPLLAVAFIYGFETRSITKVIG